MPSPIVHACYDRHFRALDIAPTSDIATIRAAHRAAALLTHPDKTGEACATSFLAVQEAKEVLEKAIEEGTLNTSTIDDSDAAFSRYPYAYAGEQDHASKSNASNASKIYNAEKKTRQGARTAKRDSKRSDNHGSLPDSDFHDSEAEDAAEEGARTAKILEWEAYRIARVEYLDGKSKVREALAMPTYNPNYILDGNGSPITWAEKPLQIVRSDEDNLSGKLVLSAVQLERTDPNAELLSEEEESLQCHYRPATPAAALRLREKERDFRAARPNKEEYAVTNKVIATNGNELLSERERFYPNFQVSTTSRGEYAAALFAKEERAARTACRDFKQKQEARKRNRPQGCNSVDVYMVGRCKKLVYPYIGKNPYRPDARYQAWMAEYLV